MIELHAGSSRAEISEVDGGRIASLRVGNIDLLITGTADDNPMAWGSYPMVPFAGRIRHGHFDFGGRRIQLDLNLPPHAIHGSGFVARWDIIDQGLDYVELGCALTWPLGGRAHQHLHLLPNALVCVLAAIAGDQPMPAVIGWHPWFVKPASDSLHFEAMYEHDDEGIPTGRLVVPRQRPWDNCFVKPHGPLELEIPGGVRVRVESDADHWVVYDQPSNATCVEPQSGPADAMNSGVATILNPGEMLQRTMTISWQ